MISIFTTLLFNYLHHLLAHGFWNPHCKPREKVPILIFFIFYNSLIYSTQHHQHWWAHINLCTTYNS